MTTRERIDDFLRQRRLAMVGVSSRQNDFSRELFRQFVQRGYDMVPVHPEAERIEDREVFRKLSAVSPSVDGAILMTPAAAADELVTECLRAGIRRVWMYRATGQGAVSPGAVEFCEKNGISVIPGYCPFMFFENTAFYHRIHALVSKLTGNYPH